MAKSAVTFSNPTGETLAGTLYVPDSGAPRAYALFAHCFTCTQNLAASRNIVAAMADSGIATLVFDFTGLGKSNGEFSDSNFSTNVEDLIGAADYLAEHHQAPRILVGHSLGGTAVLQAVPYIASVAAVATIGSPAEARHVAHLVASQRDDIERDGEAEVLLAGRPFRIKKQFLDDLGNHTVLDQVAALGKPYLVMHAPLDDTVGVDNASALFLAAKHPKSFISLDHADHLLSNPVDSRYAGKVIAAWASRYVDAVTDNLAALPERVADAVVARTGTAGFRTDINADGHALTADEPAEVGGTDLGPSPYGLLSAALAACTTMTLRMYANRKQWPLDQATATVRHEKIHAADCADCTSSDDAGIGAKIDVFHRELTIAGELDDAQRARLLEIADRCPVHRTLHGEIKVRTTLRDAS